MKFEELLKINVNEYTEDKNGLTYLSWTWAWSEFKTRCPDADYEIVKQENGLPYVFDEKTGYMVFTKATDGKEWKEMWLPVMDGNNKAMLDHEYTYKVKEYENGAFTGTYIEKTVAPATMFDINKTIMRCLVKNLAMFGLGLYIYAGEDYPDGYEMSVEEAEKKVVNFGKYKGMTLKEVKDKDEKYLYWIMEAEYSYVSDTLKDACSKLVKPITDDDVSLMAEFNKALIETGTDLDEVLKHYKVESTKELTNEQRKDAITIMRKKVQ